MAMVRARWVCIRYHEHGKATSANATVRVRDLNQVQKRRLHAAPSDSEGKATRTYSDM